jgi:hypothetical protein
METEGLRLLVLHARDRIVGRPLRHSIGYGAGGDELETSSALRSTLDDDGQLVHVHGIRYFDNLH